MSEERKESVPKERKEESGTKERKIVYLPAHEVEEEEGGEWADTKIGLYHNTGDGWRLVSKTHPEVEQLDSKQVQLLLEIEEMFDEMEGRSPSTSGSFVSIVKK